MTKPAHSEPQAALQTSGACAMSWLTEAHSIGVYPNIKELERIHGHGGKTKVVFLD